MDFHFPETKMSSDSTALRKPPNSQEAEEAVLGAILLNNRVITDVIEIISIDDFYRPQNRTIFEHMAKMWQEGEPVDVLTLQENLKAAQLLDRVGGPVYIDQLYDHVPASENAPYYAKIIHRMALRRKIVDLGRQLVSMASDSPESSEAIMDEVGQKFIDLAQGETNKQNRSMSSIVDELLRNLEERKTHKGFAGLQTHYSDLDLILGGFQKSDFIILAARPSVGKTAFALNIAENVASNGGRVAFFSVEMAAEQLALRLLSSISGVSSHLIRRGEISDSDWNKRITPALDFMDKLNISINDNAMITPLGIRADARRLALDSSKGIDLIIVDYIQLISSSQKRYESRVTEVSEISRSLKALGRELNVPILALSQLSRESEKQTRTPRLSDLRESGALEQDADVVMFLHRDEPDELSLDSQFIDMKLIISKHRNGPTGSIDMKFERHRTRFVVETKEREPVFDNNDLDSIDDV